MRVLTVFYMFFSFVTALYFVKCFEVFGLVVFCLLGGGLGWFGVFFGHLFCIQKSHELRKTCYLLLGFRNRKLS